MAYIRNLSQADWFFKDGQEAAASNAPGTPSPAPLATSAPASEEDEEEEVAVTVTASSPPVIERKQSSMGLYLIGGLGLLAIGGLVYFKFMRGEDGEVEPPPPPPAKPKTTENAAPSAPTSPTPALAGSTAPARKRKRKK